MALNYLKWLKNSAGEEMFKQVVKAAEELVLIRPLQKISL